MGPCLILLKILVAQLVSGDARLPRSLGTYFCRLTIIRRLTNNIFRSKVQYPPSSPRGGHTCDAVGGSQIISIGGFDVNSAVYTGSYNAIRQSTFNSTDPFAQGLGIFNMTSLAWEDHYTANAPAYVQSEPIRTFYADKYVPPQVCRLVGTDQLPLVPKMALSFRRLS